MRDAPEGPAVKSLTAQKQQRSVGPVVLMMFYSFVFISDLSCSRLFLTAVVFCQCLKVVLSNMAESMNGQTHMNHLWIDLLTMFVGSRQKHFSYKLSQLQNGFQSLVWKSSTGSDLSSVQHLRDEPDR